MAYLMGIDIGTSSTRVLLMDYDGGIVSIGQKEYSFDVPKEGWAEQDPEVWWNSVEYCIKQIFLNSSVKKEDITGIGFSGQMHGLVALDENKTPIRKAILWCDQRSKEEVKDIEEKLGRDKIGQITHSPIATGFLLPSLLWLKNHEKDTYNKIKYVFLPKDYIRYKMTGIIASEITDAASTTAFDCNTNNWSKEILDSLDISLSLFPKLGKVEELAGKLTYQAAKYLNLNEGTKIAYGGADQVMQAIGNGVVKPGSALVTIGSGGQILMPLDSLVYDDKLRSHCFSFVENRCYYMGAALASGLSLKWMKNNIDIDESYKEMDKKIEKIKAGSEGLIFLPYILGERTPLMDPEARGVLFGLTSKHTKYHILRAVMEGVVYSLRSCKDILEKDLSQKVDYFIATGGGSQSKVWLQMQADILDSEIYTSNMKEQSGVGAAISAGIAIGVYKSYEDAFGKIIKLNKETIKPIAENVELYNKYFRIYENLYINTKDNMHELSLNN
ncbi:MAG: xylulokinase [Pleomorphochaeta sp.]